VRRKVVREVGGFEAAFPGLYEDQVFYAKVALTAAVLVAGNLWDRYRQHPASMTGRAPRAELAEGRRRYLDWLERHLAERDVRDDGLWRALRKEQWKLDHPRLARVRRLGFRVARRLGVRW
jgi:hypothetical protein